MWEEPDGLHRGSLRQCLVHDEPHERPSVRDGEQSVLMVGPEPTGANSTTAIAVVEQPMSEA